MKRSTFSPGISLLILPLLFGPATGLPGQQTDWEDMLPEGDGKQQVAQLCSSCHSLMLIVNQRKTEQEWRQTVDDMIGRGAQLFLEEADQIAAYLGTHLSPAHPTASHGADAGSAARLPLSTIKLKPGFEISVFADNVPLARSMALGSSGTLFVGSRVDVDPELFQGKRSTRSGVYAIRDLDGDHRADRVITIASGLKMPNGVAFHEGSLYVAEVNRVLRFDGIEERLQDVPDPVVVTDALPSDLHHGWKFIRIGPDNRLYIPVGAPCNVCSPADERYAGILRMDLDGSNLEVFARGVRNSVGFDWHPETGDLWFTDNGRDHLGEDIPPDELNRAPGPGMHFGFPFCHGDGISDPEFGSGQDCRKFTAPARELGPHAASLGMHFYRGDLFPAAYRDQILIAEHGSWNRSQPLGYRLSLVRLEGNQPVSYEIFAEGWLQPDGPWGRPVDLLVLPDGSLLVSDDAAGAIYRITYRD